MKKISKRILMSISMMFLLIGLVACGSNNDEPVDDNDDAQEVIIASDEERDAAKEEKYLEAKALQATDEAAAIRMFETLNDYKDSKEIVSEYKFEEGMGYLEEKNYAKALVLILQSEKYPEDSDFISDIYEEIGDDAWEKSKFEYAKSMYQKMNDQTKYESVKDQ